MNELISAVPFIALMLIMLGSFNLFMGYRLFVKMTSFWLFSITAMIVSFIFGRHSSWIVLGLALIIGLLTIKLAAFLPGQPLFWIGFAAGVALVNVISLILGLPISIFIYLIVAFMGAVMIWQVQKFGVILMTSALGAFAIATALLLSFPQHFEHIQNSSVLDYLDAQNLPLAIFLALVLTVAGLFVQAAVSARSLEIRALSKLKSSPSNKMAEIPYRNANFIQTGFDTSHPTQNKNPHLPQTPEQ